MTEFRTTTALLPHQIPAVAKMLPIRVGALFMDMGTGKTRVALEVAAQRQGKWNRLFWFTPCALRRNVLHQILEHTNLPKSAVCIWNSSAMRKPDSSKCLMHIIGIETMGSSDTAVLAYAGLVTGDSFVVVDESSYLKGFLAKRTQRITALSAKARYRMILTGTPFTQGPVDLFAQMKFLSPKILGYKSFWSFAANHLEYEEKRIHSRTSHTVRTGRIVRSHNIEYLASRIAPYTYQVQKDDCLELPEKLFENCRFNLSSEQWNMYGKVKQDFFEEIERNENFWSAIAIFRLFTSLQSIVCGFLSSAGEERCRSIPHRRIETLLSVLECIPVNERVIIWAKYRFCGAEIHSALCDEYGEASVNLYTGAQTEQQRAVSLHRWRNKGRFLVMTQSIGSHGLTLNEAAYAVFYADSFKYSERLQAEDRIHRIGQKRRPTYISIIGENCIDERIHQALARKGNALEAFQNEIQRCKEQGLRQKVLEMVKAL